MLRMFKKLKFNGNGSYSNSIATMKVVKTKEEKNKLVALIKGMTGKSPDLEIVFTKENLLGMVWYKGA